MPSRDRSSVDRSPSGRSARSHAHDLPDFSPRLYRGFIAYLRGYFGRNFTAVRTSGEVPRDARPVIFYANHPSWWDPIHFGLLASYRLPERRVYGPMDAEMLDKYRFFKKLGVFGTDRSRRGAAAFLSTGQAVMAEPASSLWMTVEGSFADPRQRPLQLLPGLAHLVRRLSDGWVVPLALEYPFWNESQPEALSRFGEPIDLAREPRRTASEWTQRFAERLEMTMDQLAEDAAQRDPARFETLQTGRVGVGGVYDQWRRLRALAQGQGFDAAHGTVGGRSASNGSVQTINTLGRNTPAADAAPGDQP